MVGGICLHHRRHREHHRSGPDGDSNRGSNRESCAQQSLLYLYMKPWSLSNSKGSFKTICVCCVEYTEYTLARGYYSRAYAKLISPWHVSHTRTGAMKPSCEEQTGFIMRVCVSGQRTANTGEHHRINSVEEMHPQPCTQMYCLYHPQTPIQPFVRSHL